MTDGRVTTNAKVPQVARIRPRGVTKFASGRVRKRSEKHTPIKHQIDCTLVLACYNESSIIDESIESIIRTLDETRFTYEILFVDDGSSDDTVSKIRSLCARYRQCRAIFHTKNQGRGASVTNGIRAGKGRVAGYIDIDLEVSDMYIPRMIRMVLDREADVLIGKRIYRTSLFSLHRELFSVGYQKVSSAMVGTDGLDTESGYKFFHRKKILPVLSRCTHPHWFWDTESIVRAKRSGLKIVEVPVLFLRRFDKQSSVRILRDITDYIVSLWRFRRVLQSEGASI